MANAYGFEVLLLLILPCHSGSKGNGACWKMGFSYDECCHSRHGPEGNEACFDAVYGFQECCTDPGDKKDGLAALVDTCPGSEVDALPPPLRCHGTASVPATLWAELFQAHRLSQVLGSSFRGWPNITDVYVKANTSMAENQNDCIFGLITAMLHSLPALEKLGSTADAFKVYGHARRLQGSAASLEAMDCHWNRMTNHALFSHYPQLLGTDLRFTARCPVGAPRIFVYDTGDIADWPLSCSRTGFWASDVYVDRFLRFSACRVHD